MLFRETVAGYCENRTEHTNTVRTSQETHYVSATETNRLMLFREIVAVYCENHTEHIHVYCGQNAELSLMLVQPVHIITTLLSRVKNNLYIR
jgi:hypothetical protein